MKKNHIYTLESDGKHSSQMSKLVQIMVVRETPVICSIRHRF